MRMNDISMEYSDSDQKVAPSEVCGQYISGFGSISAQ